MNNYEFQKAAQDSLVKYWEKLQAMAGRALPIPRLYFDLRSKSCAGQAKGGNQIRINMGYVREHAQDLLNRTVPHEAVHCYLTQLRDPSHVRSEAQIYASFVSRRRTKRDVHGYTFQRTMRALGCDESRCHSMGQSDFSRNMKTFAYKCEGCGKEFQLSSVLHNKIQRGSCRIHTPCGRERGVIVRVY